MASQIWPTDVLFPPTSDPDEFPVADTDFATGSLRVFMPYHEWQQLVHADTGKLDRDQLYVLETLSHEVFHVLQLSLTSYGYNLSSRLIHCVLSALNDFPDLTDLFHERGRYTSAVKSIFESLDDPGEDGLTARTIMESSALHVQKATHYPGLNHAAYTRMLLEDGVEPDYRHAYDVAAEYLQEECFDHFTLIASLALMVDRPVGVFLPLVRQFARAASRTNVAGNFEMGIAFLQAQFSDAFVSVGEVRGQLGAQPILERIRERVIAPDVHDDGAYRNFTHQTLRQQSTSAALGPTFFPPDKAGDRAPMWVPPGWDQLPHSDVLTSATVRLLAAAGMILQMPTESDGKFF